jgi:nucleoid DNA-binding protein
MTRMLAAKHGITQNDARDILDTVLDSMAGTLCDGGSVSFHGLGTFSVKKRDGHVYADPSTGERRRTPPRHFVRFSVSRKLQGAVRDSQGD